MTVTATVEVALENAIMEVIRTKLTLDCDGTVRIGRKEYAQLMVWVVNTKFISEERISKVVHERLCEIGREEYEWCVEMSRHPDHVQSREALGYAIFHEKISNDELSKLSFDHGETRHTYEYDARYLLQNVMQSIRHNLVFGD